MLDNILQRIRNSRNQGADSADSSNEAINRAVVDCFNRGVISLEELKKVIQSKTPDKLVSPEYVADFIRNKVGAWELRPNCFILFREADKLDHMRRALASFFSHRESATKVELLDELRKTMNFSSVSDHDLRRIIREFASLKRGMWVFHQGIVVKDE
jgi:hypothetical protein